MITERNATFILISITLLWGASFLFMKIGLNNLEPFNIIALRFGIAFILLLPIVMIKKQNITPSLLWWSLVIGTLLFGVFTCVLFALKTSSSSNVGFVQSLTVCFVPLFESLIAKRFPDRKIIIGCIIVAIGLAFLTIRQSFYIGIGNILSIISAIIYTAHIIYTGKAVRKENALLLGVSQLGVAGFLGLIFSLVFEDFHLPHTGVDWVMVLMLAIFCSAIGFVGQSVSQKFVSPAKTGIVFSLEPLFAAVLGSIFLKEQLSALGYVGGFFILFGIIFANIQIPLWKGKKG